MGRAGEDGVEMRRQPVPARFIRIQDFQPVSRLAPYLHVGRVQAELRRQFGTREARGFRQRAEQSQMHAQIGEWY
jgi:hypothetical protein